LSFSLFSVFQTPPTNKPNINFPKKLKRSRPGYHSLFHKNAKRLITPLDLHQTLKSLLLLGIDAIGSTESTNVATPKAILDWVTHIGDGIGLMDKEVPIDRRCASLKVPRALCPCQKDYSLSPLGNPVVATIMVRDTLAQKNTQLFRDSEFRSLCSEWTLVEVLAVIPTVEDDLGIPISNNQFKIRFTANPGRELFQVDCKYFQDRSSYDCDLPSLKRLNPNSESKYCTEGVQVDRLFCYCNQFLLKKN